MPEKLVEFLRKKDYVLVKELGQGACGKTVLLRDDLLNDHFVCKKYAPLSDAHRQQLYANFIREIKLLHNIHHPNVVRIFNYYLYPEQLAGFILMEYVEGQDIDEYLAHSPERINEIFLQAIQGFSHLEANNILHRDIRPNNVLIHKDGTLRIIDLGFGKKIQETVDFDKSISLNWWCELPDEFQDDVYDFRSEVYFVGKLFEKLIQENSIDQFKYGGLLARMCLRDPNSRINGFVEAQRAIGSDQFYEIEFSEDELSCYRDFADKLVGRISKIETGTKYLDDLDRIRTQLDSAYRRVMLEEELPDSAIIIRCFLIGNYYYRKAGLSVSCVSDFLQLLKSSSLSKQRVILANLQTRLDAVTRYTQDERDDEIPF